MEFLPSCVRSSRSFSATCALATFLTSILIATPVEAANRYWVGGTGDRWESTASWSTLPRGPSGAAIPTSTDMAIFSFSGGTARIRSNVTASGILLSNLWTGSVLQGTGTIKLLGNLGLRVGSGRFIGGNAAMAIAATGSGYTQTGGIVTGIQSTFALSGSLKIQSVSGSRPTFTSTGSVVLSGTSQNVHGNISTLNNFTLRGTSTTTVRTGFQVSGTLTIGSGCTLNLGSTTLGASGATIQNYGTLTEGTGKITHYAQAIDFFSDSAYSLHNDVKAGETLYMSVTDSDQNIDGTAIDTISATITSSEGDSETVTLSETSKTSGIFHGSIPTQNSSVTIGNGKLDAAADMISTLRFTDTGDGFSVTTGRTISVVGTTSSNGGGGGGGSSGGGSRGNSSTHAPSLPPGHVNALTPPKGLTGVNLAKVRREERLKAAANAKARRDARMKKLGH